MSSSGLVLLRGRCRLEFEAHEFEPFGSSGDWAEICWLNVHPNAASTLQSMLGEMPSLVGWFEAEFYGRLTDQGSYGHLGLYRRCATMSEVVSARSLNAGPSVEQPAAGSLRKWLSRERK